MRRLMRYDQERQISRSAPNGPETPVRDSGLECIITRYLQVIVTCTGASPPPVSVKVTVAWVLALLNCATVTETDCCCPADRLPFEGFKTIAGSLGVALQLSVPPPVLATISCVLPGQCSCTCCGVTDRVGVPDDGVDDALGVGVFTGVGEGVGDGLGVGVGGPP